MTPNKESAAGLRPNIVVLFDYEMFYCFVNDYVKKYVKGSEVSTNRRRVGEGADAVFCPDISAIMAR